MTALQEAERLLPSLTRAEKAQLLQWVITDSGDVLPSTESPMNRRLPSARMMHVRAIGHSSSRAIFGAGAACQSQSLNPSILNDFSLRHQHGRFGSMPWAFVRSHRCRNRNANSGKRKRIVMARLYSATTSSAAFSMAAAKKCGVCRHARFNYSSQPEESTTFITDPPQTHERSCRLPPQQERAALTESGAEESVQRFTSY